MAQTGLFHHIGSFLLLAATVLLIMTCISSPVVNNLSILRVRGPEVTFGTFGYCSILTTGSSGDSCSHSQVGYDPASVVRQAGAEVDLGDGSATTARVLTKVMILHPIACVLSFVAFLLAAGSGFVGSLAAALTALLALLVTVVVLITDFVAFGLIRRAVNRSDGGARAEWGAAIWTLLVSAILNLLATAVVFFSCCSARLHRSRKAGNGWSKERSSASRTGTKRWF